MRTSVLCALAAAVSMGSLMGAACAAGKESGTYTTPQEAAKASPVYEVQGEYVGTVAGDEKRKIGVQVIALSGDRLQAVFLPGGLPGAGWDQVHKALADGKLDGGKVVLQPAKEPRRYMDGNPERFCATEKFPPEGQEDITGTIESGKLTASNARGEKIVAEKVQRKSPTLGAAPPKGATVLLAYEPGKKPSMEAWRHQKWEAFEAGYVQIVRKSGSNRTKEAFEGPWTLHLEFRTPFKPKARGQGRGNSGAYVPAGREVQVLDSFGLAGKPNECGGIYKTHPPKPNMCLPPLAWQTYDIEYHPPGKGKDGKKQDAWYKVVHNGVTIHERVPLGGGATKPLMLQDHGNPVAYRNIWIVLGK